MFTIPASERLLCSNSLKDAPIFCLHVQAAAQVRRARQERCRLEGAGTLKDCRKRRRLCHPKAARWRLLAPKRARITRKDETVSAERKAGVLDYIKPVPRAESTWQQAAAAP